MRRWSRHTPAQRVARWFGWIVLVAVFAAAWRQISAGTEWTFVWDAPRAGLDIASRMFPPDVGALPRLLRPLWDTLNIATLGTLLALGLGVPVALCAARNTSPSPAVLRPVALGIIVGSRSVNSLIWALLLVAVVGPGLLAGVLAIALRSVGFVAKLTFEAIEEIDPAPIEAIEATGATPAQVLGFGVWPQVAPAFAGLAVFRWDINIRESTVLGFVGAGGIGIELNSAMMALEWSQVTTILLAVLGTVVLSEAVSARLRSAIS